MRQLFSILFFLIFPFFLSSCSNEHYPPITGDRSLAITINVKDMTITFIDVDSKKKLEEWELSKPYIGGFMLPDGDSLLLFGKQVETVDIFSLRNGKKISSWETGKGIVSGKVLENQEEVVFADQSLHAVRFFSLNGQELENIRTDHGPLTILEDGEEETLYIINYTSGSMTILNTSNKKKVNSFSIHSSATGALMRDKNDEIWIGGHGGGSEIETDIHVYDTRSGKLLRTIPAPVMPINFSQKNQFVYVLSHGSNTLYQLDSYGNEINATKVGANPFEIKMMNEYVIIAGYDSNDVHLVDYETLEIEKTIPVGKGPFQLILRERVNGEQH